jgi:hypothetical protein
VIATDPALTIFMICPMIASASSCPNPYTRAAAQWFHLDSKIWAVHQT